MLIVAKKRDARVSWECILVVPTANLRIPMNYVLKMQGGICRTLQVLGLFSTKPASNIRMLCSCWSQVWTLNSLPLLKAHPEAPISTWEQVTWPLIPQFWKGNILWVLGYGSVLYLATKAYFQAKLANVYFTKELGRRCEAVGKKVTSVTLSPGFGKSGLYRDFTSCNLEDVGRVLIYNYFEYI